MPRDARWHCKRVLCQDSADSLVSSGTMLSMQYAIIEYKSCTACNCTRYHNKKHDCNKGNKQIEDLLCCLAL
jgi:hypothetical protein